jgi:uncharacterized protein (DUF1800 family)
MGPFDISTGEPNYTEQDVKEIARALAGWRFRKSAAASPFAYEWFLDDAEADSGSKTIYGQTANFTGQDVITVIANRRATARFLVKRLFEFFVYPLDLTTDADKATVERFADTYFSVNHSIKELVRAIFKSPEFFSDRAFFSLVKNPVEFVVSAIRMFSATVTFGTPEKRDAAIETSLRNMGMELFKPPNVFGWRLNLGFVTNDAMLERYNFADLLTTGTPRTAITDPGVTPPLIGQDVKKTAVKTLAAALTPFAQLELDAAVMSRLEAYLLADLQGNPATWNPHNFGFDFLKVINLCRLVVCLPEFQVN